MNKYIQLFENPVLIFMLAMIVILIIVMAWALITAQHLPPNGSWCDNPYSVNNTLYLKCGNHTWSWSK